MTTGADTAGGLLGRLTVAAAGLALVAYLLAGVLVTVPVRVADVQDCGAPAAFLLEGRVDVTPPEGTRPCREVVADRAVPAGALVVAATTLGCLAFAVEAGVVRRRRRSALTDTFGDPQDAPLGATQG